MTKPKRKPRALTAATTDDDEGVTATALVARQHALWMQIRTEYVSDPSSPSLETLAKRHAKSVSYESIKKRAAAEGWAEAREEWWTKMEVTLLERIQDEYLAERLEEMRKIRTAANLMFEHLLPVMDQKTGEPKRDPETGMPIFRHAFRSQEGVTKSWLALQERLMLLRGEATMRTDSALRDRKPEEDDNEDPIAAVARRANFSPEELRTLARMMLVKREQALADVIEDDDEDDEEDEEDAI